MQRTLECHKHVNIPNFDIDDYDVMCSNYNSEYIIVSAVRRVLLNTFHAHIYENIFMQMQTY